MAHATKGEGREASVASLAISQRDTPRSTGPASLELLTLHRAAHKGDVNCVAWCPDSSHGRHPSNAKVHLLATAGDDSSIRLWHIART